MKKIILALLSLNFLAGITPTVSRAIASRDSELNLTGNMEITRPLEVFIEHDQEDIIFLFNRNLNFNGTIEEAYDFVINTIVREAPRADLNVNNRIRSLRRNVARLFHTDPFDNYLLVIWEPGENQFTSSLNTPAVRAFVNFFANEVLHG